MNKKLLSVAVGVALKTPSLKKSKHDIDASSTSTGSVIGSTSSNDGGGGDDEGDDEGDGEPPSAASIFITVIEVAPLPSQLNLLIDELYKIPFGVAIGILVVFFGKFL